MRKIQHALLAVLAVLWAVQPAAAAPSGVPTVTRHTIIKQDPERRMLVKASYPSLSMPGALMGVRGNLEDFNRFVRMKASQAVVQFIKEVRSFSPPASVPGQNALAAGYTVERNTGRLIAVKWTVFRQLVGGAHPDTMVVTLNYDLGGGTIVLANLFKVGSPYLKIISQQATAQLKAAAKKSGYKLFGEFLTAKADNFKHFIVGEKGLDVYFNPGSVAPAVVGIPRVTIPWKAFGASLAPNTGWMRQAFR
ncbi:MAG: DUF3298 domain-containing protein [Armatimonadetes bacterium]|nr:DUF3298 domain-containing protein [Armatimonadota bacterium]